MAGEDAIQNLVSNNTCFSFRSSILSPSSLSMAEHSTRNDFAEPSNSEPLIKTLEDLFDKFVKQQFSQFTPGKRSDQLIRDPKMIALLLSDAVLLFEDCGKRFPCAPQSKKFSDFLGIVGVNSELYFQRICETLDSSIIRGRQPLKAYAKMIEDILDEHTDRCSCPNILLGGFDNQSYSRRPVYSFWLINKAGATSIRKSSYVVGCEFAEATVGSVFDPSSTVYTAYKLGMKAIQNQDATCIIMKKTATKKDSSKSISKGWSKSKTGQW